MSKIKECFNKENLVKLGKKSIGLWFSALFFYMLYNISIDENGEFSFLKFIGYFVLFSGMCCCLSLFSCCKILRQENREVQYQPQLEEQNTQARKNEVVWKEAKEAKKATNDVKLEIQEEKSESTGSTRSNKPEVNSNV